jgi:signal transduction histidine kinase
MKQTGTKAVGRTNESSPRDALVETMQLATRVLAIDWKETEAKMTLANDQNLDSDGLSAKSRQVLALREAVFTEWGKRVTTSVEAAGAIPHPILVNTLPTLYDNIAEALTPDYPRSGAATTTPAAAMEHGGERARLTNYDVPAVICEYQILRGTIFDVLDQHQVPLEAKDRQIIGSAIDSAIRDAATAFALTQATFREQFVATLAHDLRSPLAAATVAAQLIPHLRDFDKLAEVADKLSRNLQRVDRMIQDLLDTAMFQQGQRLSLHPSNFDIAELVREVCEQAVSVFGPRFDIVGDPIKGWWGRDAIKRALENLISNAVKYGAPDTPIRISFQEYHQRILLSVHNQGEPIPPDQLELVFQVFRRAKAAKDGDKQGWGIGLPYVRSVAESHGGSIDLDSAQERGTTFSLDLPVDSRPFQNAPVLE